MNVLTISVLSISLWVKRLCHHQAVPLKSSKALEADLEAEIFMTETAECPMQFVAIWVNG